MKRRGRKMEPSRVQIPSPSPTRKEGKMERKKIKCVDCGKDFPFEVGEIQFYKSKGLIEPKRCKACRALRKSTIASEVKND